MNPPSPDQILLHIQGDVEPWAKRRKGVLSLAGDPGQLLDLLSDAPNSFRVVLMWGGDDPQGELEESGIVTNELQVWLIRAKGLKATPGEYLVQSTPGGAPAFLLLLSDLRKRLRSLAFWPEEEVTYGRMLYRGCKPYPNPELAFDLPTVGYVLKFSLDSVVPHEELRNVGREDE